MKSCIVLLAEGFEEIEAIAVVDILRRADIDVTLAGIGGSTITGAHSVSVNADIKIEDAAKEYDSVVIPGGMPGALNISKSEKANSLIKQIANNGGLIASICAAPGVVLAPLAILDGKSATCYPSFENAFNETTEHSSSPVVIDGNIITAIGPGAASAFALSIVETLVSSVKALEISKAMFID